VTEGERPARALEAIHSSTQSIIEATPVGGRIHVAPNSCKARKRLLHHHIHFAVGIALHFEQALFEQERQRCLKRLADRLPPGLQLVIPTIWHSTLSIRLQKAGERTQLVADMRRHHRPTRYKHFKANADKALRHNAIFWHQPGSSSPNLHKSLLQQIRRRHWRGLPHLGHIARALCNTEGGLQRTSTLFIDAVFTTDEFHSTF